MTSEEQVKFVWSWTNCLLDSIIHTFHIAIVTVPADSLHWPGEDLYVVRACLLVCRFALFLAEGRHGSVVPRMYSHLWLGSALCGPGRASPRAWMNTPTFSWSLVLLVSMGGLSSFLER